MKFLFIALILMVSSFSYADRLLIISSGLGMYGDSKKLNLGMEGFGASLIEEGLKEKYEKVYKVIVYDFGQGETAEANVLQTLKEIIRDSKKGERLDVFSMQHGPDGSPFDGLPISQVQSIIPYGFLRNVYSTGCSEFGSIIFKTNRDNYVVEYNQEFSKGLEAMGVDSYMYHANMNATGAFTLPLLIKHMRNETDWRQAGIKAYREFDLQMAKLIPALQSLKNNDVLNTVLPDLKENLYGWEDLFISRLVIGSKKSLPKTNQLIPLNLESRLYTQSMVPMQKEMEDIISNHCPYGLSEQGTACIENIQDRPLHKVLSTVLDNIHQIFNNYDPSGKACLDGKIFNQFVQKTKYNISFEEVCFQKNRDDIFKFKWKIKQDSLLDLRQHIKTDDISGVRKVTLAKNGSIVFKIKDQGKTKIRVRGLKVFVNGIDGEGKYKELTSFKLNGANIHDSGELEGRVKLLGIPLTAGVQAKPLEKIDMIEFFRLFGFKINLKDYIKEDAL